MPDFLKKRSIGAIIAALAAIAAIAFIYFYPDAPQGNVLQQYDTVQGIANGHEVEQTRELTGQTPRWTGSLFSGMPTFQISPAYPSTSLFSWINSIMGFGLPSPANLLAMMMLGFFILCLALKMRLWVALTGAIAWGFSTYFIIIIGAGHIWKFITLAYIPPTIAGIVLAYRGKYLLGAALAALFATLQLAANHVQMTYYFLPMVLGFALAYGIQAYRAHRMRRWSIATGSLLLAAILATAANLPGLYHTYEYSKFTMRGGHSELSYSQSPTATDGLDRDYITSYSYQPSESFSLFIPDIKGGASTRPEKGSHTPMTLDRLPDASQGIDAQESQFIAYLTQYFGDPEGTNGPIYVGVIIFALALLAVVIVPGPLKWVLAILAALSIMLAWGRHMMWLTDLFIDYIPMYSSFRTVESILVVAEFAIPLLAVMALQRIADMDPDALKRTFRPMNWVFGGVALFCILGILFPEVYGSPISERDRYIEAEISGYLLDSGASPQQAAYLSFQNPRIYQAVESLRLGMVRSDSVRSLAFLALAYLLLLPLLTGRKFNRNIAFLGILALVLVDLFSVNKRYLNHDSFTVKQLAVGPPVPLTDVDRWILADTTTHYRVMDIPQFDAPFPSYYHKTIGGYHAAKLTSYQDLIDTRLRPWMAGQGSRADSAVVNMLNARYIVDRQGYPTLNPDAMGNAWLVDSISYVADANNEMAALDVIDLTSQAVSDRVFSDALGSRIPPRQPGDTIYLTSYAPDRLTYHANTAAGGMAVFSEIWFPWGWHATIDGQPAPLGRVNFVLRALRLPPGSHTIEMDFRPASVTVTDTTATVAIILIYIALAIGILLAIRPYVSKSPAK